MEIFEIKNLSFAYPNREENALSNINLKVEQGEFLTLCGVSGCGKTTLLRLLKPAVSPFGTKSGEIYFKNVSLDDLSERKKAAEIGFVMQNPDNQIVCDKVWHELAFGLESLGVDNREIRARVSEMASFFGIQSWFDKKTTELSGGQKQILNLASTVVMRPSVLILDEPLSQLDPIASQEFLNMLQKINLELGTTIILCEHCLEEVFPLSDRVAVMAGGKIFALAEPKKICGILKKQNHPMYDAVPTAAKICGGEEECPITVREGRAWLENFVENHGIKKEFALREENFETEDIYAVEFKEVFFRYEKNLPDVVKGLSLKIKKGEIFGLLGGNGAGKTTALLLASGIFRPYRGEIFVNGKNIIKQKDLCVGILGMLPQNPQSVFVKKTVLLDLEDVLKKCSTEEKNKQISRVARLCRIEKLLNNHPYDLSGGEQHRAALAKILLLNPQILLLDEPTKGMDEHFKKEFAQILKKLKQKGITIVMVSHDIEFCAEYCNRCALFFNGEITAMGTPKEFFAGNSFYTTSANRIARGIISDVVLTKEVIIACGGEEKKTFDIDFEYDKPLMKSYEKKDVLKKSKSRSFYMKKIFGFVFALLFLITCLPFLSDKDTGFVLKFKSLNTQFLQILSIFEAGAALWLILPKKEMCRDYKNGLKKKKLTLRTLVAAILILTATPFTIYAGMRFFGDRKYYFISMLIIFETMLPFAMIFESRKPKAREIVVISVLCAIAVGGRAAFFMLPQFKPVVAVVIIAGVCFGGEAGFLVGAASGFVSNFFFGQGPWTPWQMFAFGIIGFIAGILYNTGFFKKTKVSLCLFGFFATFLIYGIIMNSATVLMSQQEVNFQMLLSSCIMGLPFDLIHAVSTGFFLWFIYEAMIEKLERIKIKYGLIEP